MESGISKKMSVVLGVMAFITLAGLWLSPADGFRPQANNAVTEKLRSKLNGFMNLLPEERLYLQLDKPFYEPGETIWLSAWLRDGADLRASQQSDILTVELITPRGSVEKKINLIAKNGLAAGDFQLEGSAPGGLYKIRAYTEWMKNEGEQHYFEKEIQVQEVVLPALKMKLDFMKKAYGAGDEVLAFIDVFTNENKALPQNDLHFVVSLQGKEIFTEKVMTDKEGKATIKFNLPQKLQSSDGLLNVMVDYNGSTESISRAIPIVRNALSCRFFPEGGDLVNGLNSKVAFRVLNEFGKAADVDAELWENDRRVLKKFSSFHMGMGSFDFTPEEGKTYSVRITRPAGITEKYLLPEALDRGYVINTSLAGANNLHVNVQTTEANELSLVAQMRGKILYTTVLPVLPGTFSLNISTEKFPMGVLQLSLFDNKGIGRAERLVFVNPHRQLSVSIKSDKEKYLPREKVKLNLLVKDENGLPAPALLSMAVVNDQLLSFADDKSGNLISSLLLLDDISEKIEEPLFYFKKDEKKAVPALDLLMMTSGWRRFTWEKILNASLGQPKYQAKKAKITGTILDGLTQKPLKDVTLTGGEGKSWRCNEDGSFVISNHALYEPLSLSVEKQGYHTQSQFVADYQQGLVWYLYPLSHRVYSRWNEVPQAMENAVAAGNVDRAPRMHLKRAAAQEKAVAERAAPAVVKKRPAVLKNDLREVKEKRWVADEVLAAGAIFDAEWEGQVVPEGAGYYRAREFAAPSYDTKLEVKTRNDFRNTIYWNPRVETGHNGRATVEFFASDEITSFRVMAEGFGSDGLCGRGEKLFYTQLPFELKVKMPSALTGGDIVRIPVTLKNNTNQPLGGSFEVQTPSQLVVVSMPGSDQTVMPGSAKTIYLSYKVKQANVDTAISVSFSACALSDAVSATLRIRPRGFPVQRSFSAQQIDKEYTFSAKDVVDGSMRISFSAFPDVTSDLMKGVEGILREPYGCFEQTSCTAYPNAMVLNYLKATGSNDSRALASAQDLLDRGYKRLTTFETKTNGYEWFGASPAHEGLTAYGIMEFVDMQRAGQVIDKQMLDRTARWLLMHRDGKGGFERERHALHDFGRISDEVMNGYIVYALADAGYKDLDRELLKSVEIAKNTNDSYLLAMAASAANKLGKKSESKALLAALLKKQEKDGGFTGSSHSITYSQGRSLTIETTALAVLALLETGSQDVLALDAAVKKLIGMRDGSGAFSSTQGTVLALKALTAYAIHNKRVREDGEIIIYVDGKKCATREYKAGDRGEIIVEGLEKFIDKGEEHRLRVRFAGTKEPLPYALSVEWFTSLPESSPETAVTINAGLGKKEMLVGETVRLSVIVKNTRTENVPSAMAVVGIPAGLSVQPWQLKELQEKKVFDYYEIIGDRLALYYRGLAAADKKEIGLDLKAELPGEFNFPASCSYLYYTNEFKSWTSAGKIKISEKKK